MQMFFFFCLLMFAIVTCFLSSWTGQSTFYFWCSRKLFLHAGMVLLDICSSKHDHFREHFGSSLQIYDVLTSDF